MNIALNLIKIIMFNGNLEQQSIATIADAHAMQMANL